MEGVWAEMHVGLSDEDMNQIWKGWIKVLRGVEGLVLRTTGAVMGTAETAVTVIQC